MPFDPLDPASIDSELKKLEACVAEIKEWMCSNKLKLNDEKSEFLIISSKYLKIDLSYLSLRIGD